MTPEVAPFVQRPLHAIILPCLRHCFARNPWLALRLMPTFDPFHSKSLQRLSLRIFGRDFLEDLYAAAREVGVRPFLMWGSLLGCVREGRLLRHDRDIDVGILFNDYARKDALIAAMQKRGYVVERDRKYKLRFTRHGFVLYIDVDVFYPWGGSMICAEQTAEGRIVGASFPLSAFDRLKEVACLDGLQVLVPDPPEPVLEVIYGDWRTPVKKYRSVDNSNKLVLADSARLPEFPTQP